MALHRSHFSETSPTFLVGHLAIDNCDAKSIDSETPLIHLSRGGRNFVVVDVRGYEWGAYVILELGSDGPKRIFEHVYHCL